MILGLPVPPKFGFSWRNLLVEPIPFSGERISIAAIVKADDGTVFIPKFISKQKFENLFGIEYGNRVSGMLDMCIDCAENHFRRNPIFIDWKPPIERFFVGQAEHSVAMDLEDAIVIVGKYCSSINLAENTAQNISTEIRKFPPLHKQWESKVRENVSMHHSSFDSSFKKSFYLKEGGIKLNVGFLSERYAAQFEAVSRSSALRNALVRAQAKLWQLDLLRDEKDFFGSPSCELLLGLPQSEKERKSDAVIEFVEELKYEASKKELNIFTTSSPATAAMRVIEKAAT